MSDTDRIRAEIAVETANLHYYRGLAINAYAEVEQALCLLLAALLNIDWQAGAIILYNVRNSRSRLQIFNDLLAKRHGEKYRAWWSGIPNTPNNRGMYHLIRKLDDDRNEIAHWHIGQKLNEEQRGLPALQKPRAVQLIEPEMKSLSIPELVNFAQRANFIAKSLSFFARLFAGTDEVNYDKSDPAAWRVESWLEIYRQPALYPPPDSHPLSPNYKEPETPPQSFGA